MTRWTGRTIIMASLAIGAAGVLPLLLYVLLGPRNGNPIGLGLLAMAAVPLSAGGVTAGLIVAVVQHFNRDRRRGE